MSVPRFREFLSEGGLEAIASYDKATIRGPDFEAKITQVAHLMTRLDTSDVV